MNKREANLIADALIRHDGFKQLIMQAIQDAVGQANDTRLSTAQVAELMGVSADRVRHLARHLPHITVNGRNMFSRAGIIHYMEHGAQGAIQ